MPRTPRTQPPPPPLEINPVRVALIGTVIWAAVAVALTIWGRDWLADHNHTWWIGTAYSGIIIGLIGIQLCRRRAKKQANS
ncbi:MAG: DUF2530 domain-containing protein [Mycobacteriales bacterium]